MDSFDLCSNIPIQVNEFYSIFEVKNKNQERFYAKIFSIDKIQQYHLDETLQYNEEVLSDLQGQIFPQNFHKIVSSIPNNGFFTFITQVYQINLEQYMQKTVIKQNQALRIFDNVLKVIYSLYSNGYWHKNIRPEHFVKVANQWKLNSLVYQNIINTNKIGSQFMIDNYYQPPQFFENNGHLFTDQDSFPVVVWNLGSLLLDIFFSVHKLQSYNVLKLFKDSQFSLQSIKVKKTDIFSNKLKQILSKMLHYNPKKRMTISQLFSNEYLSKQVSRNYKQRQKNKLIKPINFKIFTGGKSALSTARLSKDQRQKGDKRFHLNQTIKHIIQMKQSMIKKDLPQQQNLVQKCNNQAFQFISGKNLSVYQSFCMVKNRIIDSVFKKQIKTFDDILENKQFYPLTKKFKLHYDKSQILLITATKFQSIQYNQNLKQTINFSQFAVNLIALMNLQKLAQNSKTIHYFKDQNAYLNSKFLNSNEYKLMKAIIQKRIIQIAKSIQQIKENINNMKQSQKILLKQPLMLEFTQIDYKNTQFSNIKNTYRKILKISYDVITKKYNQEGKNHLAKIAMYIVYSLSIDKLYLPNTIQKNFSYYFEWAKIKPNSYIDFKNFIKYIEQADNKILIAHARMILNEYFKF